MAMGGICIELKLFSEAIQIFKKALQYSWRVKNPELELLIYDRLGNAYYNEGVLQEAHYYHKRFTQGELEKNDSAIKKISAEMLNEVEGYLRSL